MEENLRIIQQLSNGADPFTGEIFEDNHICQNAKVVRALIIAVKSLENELKRLKRKENLPTNAGKLWSTEEDIDLIKEFDNGKSIKELSEIFERTTGSIQSRLVKHGKLNI